MSAPQSPRRAVFVVAALLCAVAARADDAGDILAQARKQSADVAAPASAPAPATARSCTADIKVSKPGAFCETVADCRKFCACACAFVKEDWKPGMKDDRSTTCPNAPKTGPGMLPPDSRELGELAQAGLTYITFPSGEKAAAPALEGLKRLDVRLASSANRQKYGYAVRVVSCYRPQLADTEPECGYVLKSAYMLPRVSSPADKAYWEEKGDPNNLGLAWPGRTPHSAGYGCDLILVDKNGDDSFDSRAGVAGAPRSSIDQRLASKMLDEEVTNPDVGGRRLTFEAWHYEWTDETDSRCKDPDCADSYWPVPGKRPR